MTLKITYAGTMRGQKLYTVTNCGERFFTGTLEEVKRFILIHSQKKQQREEVADALLASIRQAG